MKRHLVVLRKVYGLQDVNLASVRPVRPARPEGRPDRASKRNVVRVKDEHTPNGKVVVRAYQDLYESKWNTNKYMSMSGAPKNGVLSRVSAGL